MLIKSNNHEAVVFNYFFANRKERNKYSRGSLIFYEWDTLYSYGHHFKLAVKCKNGYVLNGDTYSSTTGHHQNEARRKAEVHWFIRSHNITKAMLDEKMQKKTGDDREAPYAYRGYISPLLLRVISDLDFKHSKEINDKDCPICNKLKDGHLSTHHCIIPFSALRGANIKPEDITILDVTKDTWEKTSRLDKYGNEIQIHHLGASLIRIGTKRYLSSIDDGAKGRSTFFLVELKSRRINTVEDGFRDLASKLDDKQYKLYQEGTILRQGEYFLEPHPELTIKDLKKKSKGLPVKLDGVIDLKVKTPKTKRIVNNVMHRENMGFGGCSREQIQVIRREGLPYYVLLDRDHAGMKIPADAVIKNNHLFVHDKLVHQYDLSQGIGNAHMARDTIQTPDGLFVRGTIRHDEHKMLRLREIWNKVYKNTAVNSWTAQGNVD